MTALDPDFRLRRDIIDSYDEELELELELASRVSAGSAAVLSAGAENSSTFTRAFSPPTIAKRPLASASSRKGQQSPSRITKNIALPPRPRGRVSSPLFRQLFPSKTQVLRTALTDLRQLASRSYLAAPLRDEARFVLAPSGRLAPRGTTREASRAAIFSKRRLPQRVGQRLPRVVTPPRRRRRRPARRVAREERVEQRPQLWEVSLRYVEGHGPAEHVAAHFDKPVIVQVRLATKRWSAGLAARVVQKPRDLHAGMQVRPRRWQRVHAPHLAVDQPVLLHLAQVLHDVLRQLRQVRGSAAHGETATGARRCRRRWLR